MELAELFKVLCSCLGKVFRYKVAMSDKVLIEQIEKHLNNFEMVWTITLSRLET